MRNDQKDTDIIRKPQFRIDLDLIRTDAWTRFVKSPAEPVYWFLLAHIVRAEVDTGGFQLYEDYYCNNNLAARWSQENIATRLGMSQGTVSKHIDMLEDMNLVVKHGKAVNGKSCCIYQLGIHDGNGHEELFLERVLRDELKAKTTLLADATLKRLMSDPERFQDVKKRLTNSGRSSGAIFHGGMSSYSPEEYIELQKPLELQKQDHCSSNTTATEMTFSKKNIIAGSACLVSHAPTSPPGRSTRKSSLGGINQRERRRDL